MIQLAGLLVACLGFSIMRERGGPKLFLSGLFFFIMGVSIMFVGVE